MATKVQLKRGSGAPATSALATGELAIDTTNKRIYTSTNGTDIVELAANPAAEIQANAGIALPDSQKATFGAGDDLQIYHDGAGSYIDDQGTGPIRIRAGVGGSLRLQDLDGDDLIQAVSNGAVSLYYDNAVKLATTSTGVNVTGNLEATGYIGVNGTTGNTGLATDRWIGGDGTAGTWFYNVPTGSNHYFAVNNTNKVAINSTGVDVTGTVTADGITNSGSSTLAGNIFFNSTSGGLRFQTNEGVEKMTARLSTDDLKIENGSGVQQLLIKNSGGIDVTGTVTADGLTVDGEVDVNSGDISLSAGKALKYSATSYITPENNVSGAEISTAGSFNVKTGSTPLNRFKIDGTTGDVSLYEDTGTTAKFFWDASAESLGIGTSSPSYGKIEVSQQSHGTIKPLAMSTTDGTNNPRAWVEYTTTASSQLVKFDSAYSSGSGYANWAVMNGKVGIGTSSPSEKLTVDAQAADGSTTTIASFHSNEGEAGDTAIQLAVTRSDSLGSGRKTYLNATGAGNFEIQRGGTTVATIDSSGNLLLGTTTTRTGTYAICMEQSNSFINMRAAGSSSLTQIAFSRQTDTSAVDAGSINTTGTSTSYATTSDYRAKEDIQEMVGATDRLMALKPCNFAWKLTGERVDGFIAHEAQAIVPEAVTKHKDAMRTEEYEVSPAVYEDVVIPAVEEVLDEEGNVVTEAQPERTESQLVSEAVMGTREVPDYQGIDQSKLVPLLTKALQEALTEIESLKARVEALEA